jgi:hypothetical protein
LAQETQERRCRLNNKQAEFGKGRYEAVFLFARRVGAPPSAFFKRFTGAGES